MADNEHDENVKEAEYDQTTRRYSKVDSESPKTMRTKVNRQIKTGGSSNKKAREVEEEKVENLISDQNIHNSSDEENICEDGLEDLKQSVTQKSHSRPVSQCIWR